MVLEYRGTTVILTGAAQLDEFGTLADAVVKSAEQPTAAVSSFTVGASRTLSRVK